MKITIRESVYFENGTLICNPETFAYMKRLLQSVSNMADGLEFYESCSPDRFASDDGDKAAEALREFRLLGESE